MQPVIRRVAGLYLAPPWNTGTGGDKDAAEENIDLISQTRVAKKGVYLPAGGVSWDGVGGIWMEDVEEHLHDSTRIYDSHT